jgi:hypothetical protein
MLLLLVAPAGAVCATFMMHAEACTIRIQLINSTARGVLALSEVVLTAKDQTVMQYSALIANLSTTRVSVASCFDNNNNTGCVSGSSRR